MTKNAASITEPLGTEPLDLLIVGAGPTGLACGIEAQRAGLRFLILDKGCLVNSLFRYPPHMVFFTSRELLEIGAMPFPSVNVKPLREEALEYYRKVTEHFRLPLHLYEKVQSIEGTDRNFRVSTEDQKGQSHCYRTRKVALATGYYDLPNPLNVPGRDLPKVSHYYTGPYAFYGQRVAVIGGANSAADAALDLYRHGAEVTLIHRHKELSSSIKYWLKPDIENRIKEGSIQARWESQVTKIAPAAVHIENAEGKAERLANDFVFALVGYHPDADFLRQAGVEVNSETLRPQCDSKTLESNVPGIYLGGVILAGAKTNEIFIENGRFHGKQIVGDLKQKLGPVDQSG